MKKTNSFVLFVAEISEDDYNDYDGMCEECWDDQLTEESEDMFGDLM